MADYELEPSVVRKVRHRRPQPTPEDKLQSASPVVRVEGAFEIGFRERFGFRPIISFGADRAKLRRLIEQWSEQDVVALMPMFFRTTDPEIRRCRFYNISDFTYWSPKLRRLAEGSAPLADRSAANAHECAKAMGRK